MKYLSLSGRLAGNIWRQTMFNEENTVEQMVLDTPCTGVTSNMVT